MIAALISLLFALPVFGNDPSPSLTRSKDRSRRYACTTMTVEAALASHPGQVRHVRARGDFVEREVVVCTERVLRPGLRSTLDEAMLQGLEQLASELALAAAAQRPDLALRTWLVETFTPSAQVAPKVGFATKAALMRQGLRVSDRAAFLGAGDVDVLTRMPPAQAYPAACSRYTAAGSLRPGDALLAVVHRDPRETILHAGVCADGQWMWLR